MKKTKGFTCFLLGILLSLSAFSLTDSAFAAPSGQTAYNQAGIRIFGQSVIKAGDSFRASNGQDVPSVITYIDGAGGKTNYLSVRQLSELLDMEVAWNAEENSVDIATWNGKASSLTVNVLEGTGENMTATAEDGTPIPITVGAQTNPAQPQFGVSHGAFQEIDPATVNTSAEPTGIFLQDAQITGTLGGFPTAAYNFHPAAGKHVVFKVTNNGATEQTVTVSRITTVASGRTEPFTAVSLAPGATLTRAFSISEDSSRLERTLEFKVDPLMGGSTNVAVSLMQYQ